MPKACAGSGACAFDEGSKYSTAHSVLIRAVRSRSATVLVEMLPVAADLKSDCRDCPLPLRASWTQVLLVAPARKIHIAHPTSVAEQVACNDTTGIGWDRQITCHTGVLGYGSIPPNRVLGSIFRHNMTGAKTGTTSGLRMEGRR